MINHCKYNGLSFCDRATSYDGQEKCRHYLKSTHFNRCMFLVFGEFCDCLIAQNDLNGLLSDKEIAEIEGLKKLDK